MCLLGFVTAIGICIRGLKIIHASTAIAVVPCAFAVVLSFSEENCCTPQRNKFKACIEMIGKQMFCWVR